MDGKTFFIYILKCNNENYYTGYTVDLKKRYQSHLNGTGSKYTRSFKPVAIARYWEIFCNKSTAMKIESRIKKLSRLQKEHLIDFPHSLSEVCNINLKFQIT